MLTRTTPPGPSGMNAKGDGKPMSVHHESVNRRAVRAALAGDEGAGDAGFCAGWQAVMKGVAARAAPPSAPARSSVRRDSPAGWCAVSFLIRSPPDVDERS